MECFVVPQRHAELSFESPAASQYTSPTRIQVYSPNSNIMAVRTFPCCVQDFNAMFYSATMFLPSPNYPIQTDPSMICPEITLWLPLHSEIRTGLQTKLALRYVRALLIQMGSLSQTKMERDAASLTWLPEVMPRRDDCLESSPMPYRATARELPIHTLHPSQQPILLSTCTHLNNTSRSQLAPSHSKTNGPSSYTARKAMPTFAQNATAPSSCLPLVTLKTHSTWQGKARRQFHWHISFFYAFFIQYISFP